jgi:hypothetical protein
MNFQLEFENFINSTNNELQYYNLSGSIRKELHELADKMNLIHYTKHISDQTITIIAKNKADNYIQLNSQECDKRRQFSNDFDLPIQIYDSPYWEYYVDLFDEYYDIKTKWVLFEETVDKLGGLYKYKNFLSTLMNDTINKLKNNDAYLRLTNSKLESPLKKYGKIYNPSNNGKYFISLDLVAANFNIIRLHDPELYLNHETWIDVLGCTEYKSIGISKKLRQVIIGNLNAKKIHTIMCIFTEKLLKSLDKFKNKIISVQADEIIIEINQNEISTDYNSICEILNNLPFLNNKSWDEFIRLTIFKLNQVSNFSYYMKEILHPISSDIIKCEPKCINPIHLAQFIKYYKGEKINDYDLTFKHEGLLATYHKSIFD